MAVSGVNQASWQSQWQPDTQSDPSSSGFHLDAGIPALVGRTESAASISDKAVNLSSLMSAMINELPAASTSWKGMLPSTAAASAPAQAAQTPAATPAPAMTINGDSINTGAYTIAASYDQDNTPTLTVTDNSTGQLMTVWGDPHVTLSNGYAGAFQHEALHVNLPDGTQMEITPTAVNSAGVATISTVAVSKNGQGAEFGFSSATNGQVSVSTAAASAANQQSGDVVLGTTGALNNMVVADGSAGGSALTAGTDTNLDSFAGDAPVPTPPVQTTPAPAASTQSQAPGGSTQPDDESYLAMAYQMRPSFLSADDISAATSGPGTRKMLGMQE